MTEQTAESVDPVPQLTVFVVDDDADVRAAITLGLERRGYVVESHASARAFLERPHPERPGCLVLDYGLPGMNGLELQQVLNRQDRPLPIIFISGHGAVPQAVQAIKGGAVDFLEKPFRQSVLVERIDAAFAQLRDLISQREALRRNTARLASLTTRERQIVRHMVGHPAEISSKEIAAKLGISPRTVDHHRARILEKTAMSSAAELIAFVQRHGLG
ncbi:response regulator [Paracoccus limosus]|uniref:Response regulator n=1 Tax=Paracoccus limosus TaxID=913252 RepID=A0A844GZP7_9RHOB|nr:response regulator [Paracoccus limosus]MTH34126.1 response regulator [Paracoccus limosus]